MPLGGIMALYMRPNLWRH